jgi:hypothetical protein
MPASGGKTGERDPLLLGYRMKKRFALRFWGGNPPIYWGWEGTWRAVVVGCLCPGSPGKNQFKLGTEANARGQITTQMPL